MVFVFGIDIPLVELIFVLTFVLIALFALMIYIIIKQNKLNKRLEEILSKENLELGSLKNIRQEEETEANLLRTIRAELDKMVYGEAFGKKIEMLMKTKGKGIKASEKERIHKMAEAFWKEIVNISKKKGICPPVKKLKKSPESEKKRAKEAS